MICQECGKNQAQVFFKQIVNNQVTEYALCPGCADKKGLSPNPGNLFLDILAGLGGLIEAGRKPGQQVATLKCSSCGMRYGELEQSGRLGCPACYVSFREPLAHLLKRIHGYDRHTGKHPPQVKPERETPSQDRGIENLRHELKKAINREDFETAARLRDQIRQLEKKV